MAAWLQWSARRSTAPPLRMLESEGGFRAWFGGIGPHIDQENNPGLVRRTLHYFADRCGRRVGLALGDRLAGLGWSLFAGWSLA